MEHLTLRIRYKDRRGLVLDISTILLKHGLNIEALQLMNNLMYVETNENGAASREAILEEIGQVRFVVAVSRIAKMPFRAREEQMAAIMNSISPLEAPTDAFDEIIGDGPAIRSVLALARRVASTDSTVMLRGESGTGKELFAKAIHRSSGRGDKVFVPVNCGAIPEHLLESELFGYEEGAFSGAKKGGRVGLFQFAGGGTIFLDEITEMPMHLQVKLLRVLQEGRLRPLGTNEELPLDSRIIAATNRDVEAMVASGTFREDLYYRLNVIPIHVPALRDRIEDIPALVEHCLARLEKRGEVLKRFSREAMSSLRGYSWPGNVRELENVVNRALNFSRGVEISPEDIVFDGDFGRTRRTAGDEKRADVTALKGAAEKAERELIQAALSDYGSIRAAARALGVSHTTVANKVKKYGITLSV